MKKLLLVASLVVATAVALGQGTVNFNTRVTADNIVAPVTDVDGTLCAGTAFNAQMYWGTTPDSLAAVGTPIAFRTGSVAGFLAGGNVTLPVTAGATVNVQVRAWATAGGVTSYEAAKGAPGGKWGESNIISIKTGGYDNPPALAANLVGLTGFQLVPEPSTIALVLLGAAALLLRRRQ